MLRTDLWDCGTRTQILSWITKDVMINIINQYKIISISFFCYYDLTFCYITTKLWYPFTEVTHSISGGLCARCNMHLMLCCGYMVHDLSHALVSIKQSWISGWPNHINLLRTIMSPQKTIHNTIHHNNAVGMFHQIYIRIFESCDAIGWNSCDVSQKR